MKKLSGCLGNDKNAHEEDHDEKDPHEKPIHHLGNLLPLCYLNTRSSLLTETVGDVLDVLHHLFMLDAGAAAGAGRDLSLL